MAYLIKPELEEMRFRQKLHESVQTMGGKDYIDPFPKEKWLSFYKEYVEADSKEHFYRYQYCPDCADFTGELGWNRNHIKNRYELFILIQYERRRDGYGIDGIEHLLKAAGKEGIAKLYAPVCEDKDAVFFFDAIGMKREGREGNLILFSHLTKDPLIKAG